jgi:cysteine desulfurase / selenocysteine lyase
MLTGAAAQTWIHLNAAGSSPASDASHAATICHLELEKEMGGYAAASAAPADAHGAIARLLNCSAAEIALADSAQQAWARAFYSLNFRAGDRILCFENEYGGNAVAFLQAQQRCPGLDLEVLPMRSDGIIDVSALKAALYQTSGESAPSAAAPPRVLVALTHVQTGSSIVQPPSRHS